MKRRVRNLIGWALGRYACPNCKQTMWQFSDERWTLHTEEEWRGGSRGHYDCNHCGHCPRPDRLVWL